MKVELKKAQRGILADLTFSFFRLLKLINFCPWKLEESASPGARVTGTCDAPKCRCYKQNSDLLQEERVFLTAEPFLSPKVAISYLKYNQKYPRFWRF